MTKPEEALLTIRRRYGSLKKIWLAAESEWPIIVPLKGPENIEMTESIPYVCKWLDGWRDWVPSDEVEWESKRWKHGGIQRIPKRLTISNPDRLAELSGKSALWQKSKKVVRSLDERWPTAHESIIDAIDQIVMLDDDDLQRFIHTVEWLVLNPDTGLLIRQVPIRGIDTKWLEKRKALIFSQVAALRTIFGTGSLIADLGLCILPERVRLVILDPDIRKMIGGIRDLTIPLAEAEALILPLKNAIIVENLQTAISLPDLPHTIAVAHLGYHVDVLGRLPWLASLRCFYWGDIDTHGLAILSRARKYLPTLESLMMDKETLLEFKDLWAFEKDQSTVMYLEGLTEPEQNIFNALKNNVWGTGVRLEQERIELNFAAEKLLFLV